MGGGIVGYCAGKARAIPDRLARRRLETRVQQAEADTGQLRSHTEVLEEQVATLREQRDDYAQIAESHVIDLPPQEDIRYYQAWKAQKYTQDPAKNLAELRRDLQRFVGHEIDLVIRIRGTGQWVQHIQGCWGTQEKELKLVGLPEEVLANIGKHFAGKLMIANSWICEGPLIFSVDLHVEGSPPLMVPEIRTVEILRTQTEIVERIVPKAIFVDLEGQHIDTGIDETRLMEMIERTMEIKALEDPVVRVRQIARRKAREL